MADALDKVRHFVLGCRDLTIAVDHRPLLKIFGDRSLDHISNTRLRNLKEKTLRYKFRMAHIPGVKNRDPDALSRFPTGNSNPPEDDTTRRHSRHLRLDHHTSYNHNNPTDGWHLLRIYPPARPGIRPTGIIHISPTLHLYGDMGTGTGRHLLGGQHVTLINAIEDGFPESKHMLPQPIRDYHHLRHHLSCCD